MKNEGYPPEVRDTGKSDEVVVRYSYNHQPEKSWLGFGHYDFFLRGWKIDGRFVDYLMYEWWPLPESGSGVEIPR